MEWAMGTLRGCRRDAVPMDGQEVGERSGGDRSGQSRGSGHLPGPMLDLLPRLRPQTFCPLTDLPSINVTMTPKSPLAHEPPHHDRPCGLRRSR